MGNRGTPLKFWLVRVSWMGSGGICSMNDAPTAALFDPIEEAEVVDPQKTCLRSFSCGLVYD